MVDEKWQVAGSAAEIYEERLVPAIFAPWAEVLLEKANLERGAKVLDVACGTGLVARTAAGVVGPNGKVVGLDLNAGMLEVARARSSDYRVESEWHEASADAMPFIDGEFDFVFCQLGLQFFLDRVAALREMNRVLTAGGKLAVLVWRGIEHSPGFDALARQLDTYANPQAAAVMRAPFAFGDNGDGLRSIFLEAGFSEVHAVAETRTVRFPSPAALFEWYAAGSPIAPHVAGLEEGARTKLKEALTEQLQIFNDDDGLFFPIQGHVVTAQK